MPFGQELSPSLNSNSQTNTWFMKTVLSATQTTRNRLYDSRKMAKKLHLNQFRVYLSGTNLLTFSNLNFGMLKWAEMD